MIRLHNSQCVFGEFFFTNWLRSLSLKPKVRKTWSKLFQLVMNSPEKSYDRPHIERLNPTNHKILKLENEIKWICRTQDWDEMRQIGKRLPSAISRGLGLKVGKRWLPVASNHITHTEPKKSLCTGLGECCRQIEAEEVKQQGEQNSPNHVQRLYRDRQT